MVAKGMPKAIFVIKHKGFDVPPQFFNCDTVSYRGYDADNRVKFILYFKTLFSYHVDCRV